MFTGKKTGASWDFYISVCIRNCDVLNFLESDDKCHGIISGHHERRFESIALMVTDGYQKILIALIIVPFLIYLKIGQT